MAAAPRIVSLIASSTEIVCALGCEQLLVGRSHECDYPATVKRLPQVTAPKFEPDGTSYQIHERLKAIVQEGLTVYRVDAALLDELRPDVIITQDQCEVCAVSLKDVEAAVCQIISSRPRIVSLETNSMSDLWRDIMLVAESLEVSARGVALVAGLQARVEAVKLITSEAVSRPTVATIEWIDPLMTAGNWVPEIVDWAGGTNLFGEAGKHSPWMSWEQIIASNPEYILVLPCGFDLKRIETEMDILAAKPGWKNLKAVASGNVYLCDSNQFMSRPGPRLVDSLEIIAEIIQPELFVPRFKGSGWKQYPTWLH